ncbi:MAG: adenylyl-sulfate kinase, partial [Candidatus Omnitrophica bacterium]|nr:adenylyl-sulfate kinase [Candidatus Omnitrophota bacterium]
AGKTTISDILTDKIKTRYKRTEHLDGDVIREFFPRTGFTRKDRDDHIRRVAYLAACLQRYDVMVIASLISPYEDSRRFARKLCKNFVEVYVSTSLSVCERRDVKGLYAKARSGEISHFTGIDEPYETPSAPDITIDTSETSADQAADRIIEYLEKKYGDV